MNAFPRRYRNKGKGERRKEKETSWRRWRLEGGEKKRNGRKGGEEKKGSGENALVVAMNEMLLVRVRPYFLMLLLVVASAFLSSLLENG